MPTGLIRVNAEEIVKLADKGVDMVLRCYNELQAETFEKFADVQYVIQYKKERKPFWSVGKRQSRVFVGLMNSVYSLEKITDPAQLIEKVETHAEMATKQVYPKSHSKTATRNRARDSLLSLLGLAKKYRMISILATQFLAGVNTFGRLETQVAKLKGVYDEAYAFVSQFRDVMPWLKAEKKRIREIGKLVSSMEREFVRGETEIIPVLQQ